MIIASNRMKYLATLIYLLALPADLPSQGRTGGGSAPVGDPGEVTGIRPRATPPWHITIADTPVQSQEILAPPYVAPGDSLFPNTFDYLTNGSVPQNWIDYADGTMAIIRMASIATDWADLGSFFNFSYGSGWVYPWGRIESSRAGWPSMSEIPAAGGVNVVVSQRGDSVDVYVDAAKGANVWSKGGGFGPAYWPRVGVTDPFYFHIVYCDSIEPTAILYARSLDAGITFDQVGSEIFTHQGVRADADGYDLVASGTSIAILAAGQGGDVVLAESSDNGETWSETVLFDAAGPGELPFGMEEWQPDGACSLVRDGNGNLHAMWSNYLAIGDSRGDPNLYYSVDAGLMYWSVESGVEQWGPWVTDRSMSPPVGRDGNYLSQPALVANEDGDLLFVCSQTIPERDRFGNNYKHVFGGCVNYFNRGWAEDLTRGTGFDASFAMLPNRMEDVYSSENRFVYQASPYAGNWVTADHPFVPAVLRIHVGYFSCSIPGRKAPLQDRPLLLQNHPNPFNSSSVIEFEIAEESPVRLTVFDLLGREVAVLVNEALPGGTHTRVWDATGYPSGTYFYRLTVGNVVETRRLVLLK